jgi:hypothetical protein
VESSESRSERGIGLQKPENLLLKVTEKQMLRYAQHDRYREIFMSIRAAEGPCALGMTCS